MMYSYYVSRVAGTVLTMIPAMQKCLNMYALFVLTSLRLVGLWSIVSYISTPAAVIKQGSGTFSSDMDVLLWYTMYQWVGGIVFARSFAVASSLFWSLPEKAKASTVMNVVYFAGMVGVSIALLFVS